MKLLIVEDEISMQKSISTYFEKSGYICEICSSQKSAQEKITLYHYDCVILDITLPDGNGLTILEYIKKNKLKTGVVILSAKDSIDDKVKGLTLGADDYLAKPFHFTELNARVTAIVRRLHFEGNHQIEVGNIRFNLEEQKAYVLDNELVLKKKEYELLLFLVSNSNRIVSKSSIAEHIWGDNSDRTDTYDFLYSQIKNLRKKLHDHHANFNIQAIYGLGYKLEQE